MHTSYYLILVVISDHYNSSYLILIEQNPIQGKFDSRRFYTAWYLVFSVKRQQFPNCDINQIGISEAIILSLIVCYFDFPLLNFFQNPNTVIIIDQFKQYFICYFRNLSIYLQLTTNGSHSQYYALLSYHSILDLVMTLYWQRIDFANDSLILKMRWFG